MTSLELAITFIGGVGKKPLSDKQAEWLLDLRKKEGHSPLTGCLGETGAIIEGRKEIIFLKEAKTSFSAYGGGVGKKGTGKYFLIAFD